MTDSRSGRSRKGALDDVDRRIVAILQDNGRTSNREIGRKLHVSEATVRNRISRLLADGLINIVAVPTPTAVGMTLSAIIGVSVSLPRINDVVADLITKPEVRYAGLSTGRYEVILEAFFSNQEHLLEFVTEDLGSMDGVTQVETSIILRVAKFSYEWEVPVE
ncbi:MAG TPA: Lrp/AsnC family transcriptional regulator [Acidimicrobiia bacterium]|nr:Lrp/AsnC family transcriptional regulator [Acidimicrobiia bacterium]